MLSSMQNKSQINNELSLYIPHVFPNFTEQYIANVFEFLDLGRIDHVDLVSKIDKNGKSYNSAYVHFAEWFVSATTENFQSRVINPNKEARIVHDDPWYWIVLENTTKKQEPGARKQRINLTPTSETNEIDIEFTELSDKNLEEVSFTELYNQKMDIECEFKEKEDEIIIQNLFNGVIMSNTLEQAKDHVCNTLYKLSYQDYIHQESIEENPNNYLLCAKCLIWYDEGNTKCTCGECVKFSD